MRPNLGTRLWQYIFENNGPFLGELVKLEIATAVANNIPQIRIVDISVIDKNNVVEVNVIYSVNGLLDQTGSVEFAR